MFCRITNEGSKCRHTILEQTLKVNLTDIFLYDTTVHKKTSVIKNNLSDFCNQKQLLTLQVPTPENGQTHSDNSSATADKLFECT